MRVGPLHVAVDVGVAAVVLAELAGHDRHLRCDASEGGVPAVRRRATGEVVRVIAGDELANRVVGSPLEPAVQHDCTADPAERDRLPGSCRADRVDECLHPGRLPALGCQAPVPPAGPRECAGLVVDVEDHRTIALERACDARPESGRVIGIGHQLLADRRLRPRGAPVQIEDDVEAGGVQPFHVSRHRVAIRLPSILRLHGRQVEPAGLVERDADDVDPPALHRRDRCGVHRPGGDAATLRARDLEAGAVHSEQANRLSLRIHEPVADNANREGRGRGGRGRRNGERQREKAERKQPHDSNVAGHRQAAAVAVGARRDCVYPG